MKKLVDYLKRLFYTSWIGALYFDFLLWLDRRKFKKEMQAVYSKPQIQYQLNSVKMAYDEGVLRIKHKVAELATSKTKEEYEKVLGETVELLNFSASDRKEEIEALKKVYLYNGADIKSNTDRAKMIDQRIRDFEELRKHKELRQKLRQERSNGRTRGN